jgi:hypothetical protein
VTTSNGTSSLTIDYNPYPSTLYYLTARYETQPFVSTVAVAMPSPITNVSLDQLTTESTDFSCTWSAAPSTAVTVRYYSTTSAVIPATRSQVGTTQSVAANLSTNSLSPALAPLSTDFYYVGVTPTRGPEVLSAPAFQPIDANLPTAAKGSLAFTGGWLSLTSNWTLPIVTDSFTIEAFISTTKPLITTQRDDPNGSGNTLTYWGEVDDYTSFNLFNIETPDNNEYYLNSFNNNRPAGNASALVNTVANGNWHHVVAQGSNNVYSLYYDGKFLGSRAVANYTPLSNYTRFLVGARSPPYNFFRGFMASVRIVNGINVYSGTDTSNANFTVPTEPLTATQAASSNIAAITGVNQNTGPNDPTHISTGNNYTALLLQTDYDTPFLDGSSNAFTLTSNGAVVASRNNPFGPAVFPTRVPDAPTNVVGTPGSEQVTVTWTLPLSNGGTTITSYTVTASPGAITRTINGAAVSSYVFTGLTNGTAYTFTVYATNSKGNSATSVASAAVTPAAAAAAPTALVATRGNASASIAFTPGATGGGTISNYKYSTDGGSSFTAFSPAQTTSPVSITGLTNGTTYSVALRAVTQVGDGDASATVSVTPSTVPGAPTAVSGSHGNSQVTVAWSAPSSDGGDAITSYTVQYSTDGTNYTAFGSTFVSSPGLITGLTNGTAYTFKVFATNGNGNSDDSTASAAVTPSTVPSEPVGVVGTRGNTSVGLNWSPPSSTGGAAIDYYAVEYSSDGTNYTVFGPTFAGLTGTVTGLTNGTAYTFRVSAHNLNGFSSPSAPSAPVTPSTVPNAPTGVTGTVRYTAVALTWSAPVDDGGAAIDYYTAAYSTDGTNYTAVGTTFPSTSGTVTGLTNGTAYTFKVSAHNTNGDSVYSTASASVTPSTTAPDSPTSVSGTHGNGQISVAWSPPSYDGGVAITSYTVNYSTDGSTYTPFSSTFSASPGLVTGLTNGTAYTFKVFATNTLGNSVYSAASASVTPSTISGAPTAVLGSRGNGQVTVFWSAPSNNGGANITSYTVKYSTDGSTYTAFGSPFSSSPGLVTGLTNGTPYTFKVFATNLNGNSTDSTASAAVTPSAASREMVWDPTKKGTDVVINADGLGVSQQFGYRQTALATRIVATGEKVVYSIQPVQIGPAQTMTVGWGTSAMHYNGTVDAYTGYPGTDDQSVGVDFYGSSFYNSTAQVTQLPVYSTVGDVVDMALHDGVGWWIRVNGGLWNNDPVADPATDAGGLSVQGLTALFPAANPAGGGRADGALLLLETSTYTIPSGYTFI